MKRIGVALLVIAIAAGGLYFGARKLLDTATSSFAGATCTFGSYSTDTGQAAVAATMVGVTLRRGLPERAAVLVITAAWQESKLRNVAAGSGDLDSVGVLQQRPSQGWGTEQELADIAVATGRFLDAVVQIPDWQTEPAAEVIQAVQISADGRLYARHEAKSIAMAAALTGSSPAAISCEFAEPDHVASTEKVAEMVASELPVSPPTVSGSTVSVPGAGWAAAAWFVANADRLGIDRVGYDRREWTREDGWRDADAEAAAVTATMAST